MSAPTATPEWGDDLLAIAEAVGVVTPSGRPHLTAPGTLLDLTARLAVATLLKSQPTLLDEPVPFIPTDHTLCSACGDTLCGCEVACEDLQRDMCSHYGQPYCYSCAAYNCADCRDDQERWDRR